MGILITGRFKIKGPMDRAYMYTGVFLHRKSHIFTKEILKMGNTMVLANFAK